VDPSNGEGIVRDSLQRPRFPRWLVAVLVVLVIAVIAGGYWFYRDQNQTARETAQEQLAAIAQLKVNQIMQWRAERLGDAGVISGTPFVREVVSRWLQTGQATDEEQILAWLETVRSQYGYSGAALFDPSGKPLLSVGSDNGTLTPAGVSGVEAAIANGKPTLTDLYLDASGNADLDAIAPLSAAPGSSLSPLGAVVLHSVASEFLYPLVQSWPTPSNSAEILLVRREGDAVLFLNELRFRSGTSLRLSFPLSKSDLPATMAVQGKKGLVEAPDYRGVEVLADIQPIPGSPWFMVAKVDTSEVFGGTILRSGLIWGLIAVLLVAVIGGSLLVWQWGLKRRYREAYAAEAERRGLLERFEHVVKQAADIIFLADEDLQIVEANDLAVKTYGYSSNEFMSKRIPDLMPLGLSAFEASMADGRGESDSIHETVQQRKDGSVFPAEVSDRKISLDGKTYYQAIIRDVTERKQAEDAVTTSEVRYRRLFEAAQDGILILDADSGTVVDANPFLEELLGYSHAQLLGTAIWDLGAFKDIVANWAKFDELQRNDYVRYEDLPLETSDGRLVSVEFVSNSYAANHQRVIQCNIRDISERKRAEENLRKSEEQLRQSQKMEAVGQLAGGIAHDFNNLLTSILGYSELLLTSGEISDSPACKDVQEIKHAAERAGALTRQILAFSRRQALRPDVVSLNEVLNGMEPLLRRTLGENIDLVSLEHPDLGHAEIDVHQFEQVLMNLAINARAAMPSGGRLTLETANVELDEEYCRTHPEATPGACVMLAVSDTGIGMDEATLGHAFEPFFTTKAPGEGTGLGLAMVYGIVKQSRGNIFVYSEPGKGTTFKIYLPRVATREATEAVVLHEHIPSLGNEAVMVVEDESSLRSLIERVLGAAGYKVVSFGSADEAMAALEQSELAMDLLLTDVVLPGVMQGNDLARRVQDAWPDLPVLYMSGYTRNAIVHAGRLDEGINFLEKPFTPEALARMVREVLDQAGTAG
jgi:two-component system cell cycle sensor histidine kinase/response regulator CckA